MSRVRIPWPAVMVATGLLFVLAFGMWVLGHRSIGHIVRRISDRWPLPDCLCGLHRSWPGTADPNWNHLLCVECARTIGRAGEAVCLEGERCNADPCCACGLPMHVGHRWTGRPNMLGHCPKALRREGRFDRDLSLCLAAEEMALRQSR